MCINCDCAHVSLREVIVQHHLETVAVLSLGVLLASGCGSHLPVPSPSPSTTVTLYYVQSQRIEPWAPEINGERPAGWTDAVRSDLAAASFHPLSIEQRDLRATVVDPAICSRCPDFFVLAVMFPAGEREAALERCFVADIPDFNASATTTNQTAASRRDCQPFYVEPRS